MHVLLVEDQAKLADNIRRYLELERYAVTVSADGQEAYEKAMSQNFDVMILDVGLPTMDGFAICRQLRENGKRVPILMLTARGKRQDIIDGLNLGADDYLPKPFDLEELLARIRALLRRGGGEEKKITLHAGDVALDTNTQEVTKEGAKVALAPKEYALLEFLMRRQGNVQSRTEILEHVWGDRDELLFSQTVDVHVAYLRRKLGKDIIRTVPGKGYFIPS
jgi:DNA-binding response OmpR family regulator